MLTNQLFPGYSNKLRRQALSFCLQTLQTLPRKRTAFCGATHYNIPSPLFFPLESAILMCLSDLYVNQSSDPHRADTRCIIKNNLGMMFRFCSIQIPSHQASSSSALKCFHPIWCNKVW